MSAYRTAAEQDSPTYQDYLADPEAFMAPIRAAAHRDRAIALSAIAGELRRICRDSVAGLFRVIAARA